MTETDDYAAKMREWRRSGGYEDQKPRANQQVGPHIDTLPVEANPPMRANKLVVIDGWERLGALT